MVVRVDDMEAPFGRMIICHMIADSDKELISMADYIGVQRRWHQYPGTRRSHFDICQSKRKLAVRAGAVEISSRELGRIMLNRRQKEREVTTKKSKSSSKYKIINIRGCNGSGKSWIIRKLMKKCDAHPIYADPEPGRLVGRVVAYRGEYKGDLIYFVGSYETMSGGADHVMKCFGEKNTGKIGYMGIDYVCDLVRSFAGKGHVFFEGFIISGLFSRFYKLSQELGGITWCYLDTPLEVCYKRIEDRNKNKTAASGRIKGSIGIKHVEKKFIAAERTRQKFNNEGEETVIIDYRKPMRAIYKLLKEKKQ